MILTVKNIWRLARAGRTMARYDFFLQPEQVSELPWFARALLKTARFGAAAPIVDSGSRVTAALSSLGPSYIKLGQFLSTRPDVIGAKRAFELKSLQDRLPPFSMAEARETIQHNLGQSVEDLFKEFGEPVAAASIAQVHKAMTRDGEQVAEQHARDGARVFGRE